MSVRQQWEYRVIGPIKGASQLTGVEPYYPAVITLKTTGAKVDPIRGGAEQESALLSGLIAQMGMDGWELVSTGDVSIYLTSPQSHLIGHLLYFKRPI